MGSKDLRKGNKGWGGPRENGTASKGNGCNVPREGYIKSRHQGRFIRSFIFCC
jgi:hypothetical protein